MAAAADVCELPATRWSAGSHAHEQSRTSPLVTHGDRTSTTRARLLFENWSRGEHRPAALGIWPR